MILNGKKIVATLFGLSLLALVFAFGYAVINQAALLDDTIGLIYVDDVITGQRRAGLFESPQPAFLTQLRSAKQDPAIRALVIRINSPGGSSGTSQELYQTVRSIRDSGIPVVVSMADIATSGGYYLASAADYIFANGSTMTGSIGVIMQLTNYQELYDKIGIQVETIKSGQFKDVGNPSRSLTGLEEQLLTEVIIDAWDQFVADVATGRNLPRDTVEQIADGRIMTGRQALEHQLIDELGGLEEAFAKAKELAGITGNYSVRTYQRRLSLLERVLSNYTALMNNLADLYQFPVQLKYQL